MWSKDIILLFSDGDTEGTQAWLRAYHGVTGKSPLLELNFQSLVSLTSASAEHNDGPLPVGGGSIWSAITLDYPHHSFSHIGLYYGKYRFYIRLQWNFDLSPLGRWGEWTSS